jgi:DNA-binding NtrC family response regulator
MRYSLLVVEDDPILNKLLIKTLTAAGFDAVGAATWASARERIAALAPDLVLLDMNLPDANDFGPLAEIGQTRPVIMLTAYGSINHAVEAMRLGAVDYLLKPVNLEELELVIHRALENSRLRAGAALRDAPRDGLLLGQSAAMRRLSDTIDLVARDNVTVLIRGESGVGKELVAQALHERGRLRTGHFVAVDCCTLQSTLFESELFGHERGAFTSADRRKLGLIEAATGGTLFLDEIGEVEPAQQAKLLRVLETGRFRRVGATADLRANARVVAATNRDLTHMVQGGAFRADLFYRLAAFEITVPPLRAHKEDIPALVEHFARKRAGATGSAPRSFSPNALKLMMDYDWPGNVRELRNVVERALLLASHSAVVDAPHLPTLQQEGTSPPDATMASMAPMTLHGEPSLKAIERFYLAELLDRYDGNRRKVAEVLGVSERTAYRMLERYGFKGAADEPH